MSAADQRAWRERHPGRAAEVEKRWRDRHPEIVRERNAAKYAKYRVKYLAQQANRFADDPSIIRARNLRNKYRMSIEDYDRMLATQGGACAICHESPPGETLAVDHDHSTDVVRGLLCGRCNRGIGHLRDNSSLLRSAADYLDAKK